MANVLITGGSGLIGWCATAQLVREGHRVVVFDLRPNHANLAGIEGGLTVVPGDVTDLPLLLATMKRHEIDHVLHLAAFITDQAALDPAGAFKVNVVGAANIFDAALALDVRRVVWTSSVTALAVGDDYDNRPVDESWRMISSGAYGASKYACEVMAEGYRRTRGLDAIAIRPALTYGIGRLTGGTGAFNAAIRRMALGQPTGVMATETLHQAMYNKDMAALLIAALFASPSPHAVFNTPVERDYGNDEMLDALRRACPEAAIHLEPAPDYVPRVPVMDGARARAAFGFAPRYSLEEGVREMIAHFRAHPDGEPA